MKTSQKHSEKNICTEVWYHADCMDGLGAVAAYWDSISLHNIDRNKIKLRPMNHGDTYDLTNVDNLIMLDYTVKANFMRKICEQVENVLVIDHHKSAESDLKECENIENLKMVFDMNKSGAVLSWEYFNPDKAVPQILKYIQDRDLWQHTLDGSRQVSAYLFQYVLGDMTQLIELFDYFTIDTMVKIGGVILTCHNKMVDQIIKNTILTDFDGVEVLVVNSPILQSEIGDCLNQSIEDNKSSAKYVMIRHETVEHEVYSLRSRGEFDVSEVAVKHGGGGHVSSAGFRMRLKV